MFESEKHYWTIRLMKESAELKDKVASSALIPQAWIKANIGVNKTIVTISCNI